LKDVLSSILCGEGATFEKLIHSCVIKINKTFKNQLLFIEYFDVVIHLFIYIYIGILVGFYKI
jgi:hypothetical protein